MVAPNFDEQHILQRWLKLNDIFNSSPSAIAYSFKSSIGIFTFIFVESPLAFNSTFSSLQIIFRSWPNVLSSDNNSVNFLDSITKSTSYSTSGIPKLSSSISIKLS